MEDKPIAEGEYILQKFPGKGGWTYAEIPEVPPDKKAWFNWIKVRGFIDDFELKHSRLMPLGNGNMMLPVKVAIRKSIKKEAGDTVHITLFRDDTPIELPEELIECLEMDDKRLLKVFKAEPEGQQKGFIEWIYEARKEETKAKRIIKMIDYLKTKM